MAHNRRHLELQGVKQLVMVDHEIEPAIERMRRFRISRSRARKSWRVDSLVGRKPGHEASVGRKAPWPMQIDQRRAAAGNLDIGRDPVLPEPKPPHLWRRH